jgi:hypothetical protein
MSLDTFRRRRPASIFLNNYVAAAGGRFVNPPYPAANESGGIYYDQPTCDVEPASYGPILITSTLWYRSLRLSLESVLFKPA